MSVALAPAASRNSRKHTNSNPLQRWLIRRFHARVAALVAEALARSSGSMVLDVGCGEGHAAAAIGTFLPGVRVTGVDWSRRALLSATGADPHPSPLPPGRGDFGCDELARVQGNAVQLPFRDRAVPVVMCLEVLEHLPDPWAALEEMRRASSGYLVLSVPDQPWFSAANFLRGNNLARLGEDPEHLWHWRGDTFVRQLKQRCRVLRIERSFPWVIALAEA
jgi:SAM-dependent methyltransferase